MRYFQVPKSPSRHLIFPHVLFIRERGVRSPKFPQSAFVAAQVALLSLFSLFCWRRAMFHTHVDDWMAARSHCFQHRQGLKMST